MLWHATNSGQLVTVHEVLPGDHEASDLCLELWQRVNIVKVVLPHQRRHLALLREPDAVTAPHQL